MFDILLQNPIPVAEAPPYCIHPIDSPEASCSGNIDGLGFRVSVNPIKLETGLRPNSAKIPYTLLLRIEAIGFPTFGLLLKEP